MKMLSISEAKAMDLVLQEERFDYLSTQDKAFIRAFDDQMTRLGYSYGGSIGSGYCWGNHMLIYRKMGVKSETVYARVYMRKPNVALRLFLNNVDKHRAYIEQAPEHIKDVFTNDHGRCQHCENAYKGDCRFRKTFSIDGERIEKCSGVTFEFRDPCTEKMDDYIGLFSEFFPGKRGKRD